MSKVKLNLMDFTQRQNARGGFGYLALSDHDDLPEGHEIRLKPVEGAYEVHHIDETGSQVGEVARSEFEEPDGILATAQTYSDVEKAIESAVGIAEEIIKSFNEN